MEKIYPNKKKQTPLPSARCSHSFCRRDCSISESGKQRSEGALAMWRKPRPQNAGSPKSRSRCQGKPRRSQRGTGHTRSRFQTKLPLKQYCLKALPSPLLVLNTFISRFSIFFLIWCIGGSTFLYFGKLQTKVSHPGPLQGHTETISNRTYMPANSKYFPNNT